MTETRRLSGFCTLPPWRASIDPRHQFLAPCYAVTRHDSEAAAGGRCENTNSPPLRPDAYAEPHDQHVRVAFQRRDQDLSVPQIRDAPRPQILRVPPGVVLH